MFWHLCTQMDISSVVHMKSNALVTWGINLHPTLHYFYLVFLFNQVTKSLHFNLQVFQNGTAELGKLITYWHNTAKNRDLYRALKEEAFLQMEKLLHRVKVSSVKNPHKTKTSSSSVCSCNQAWFLGCFSPQCWLLAAPELSSRLWKLVGKCKDKPCTEFHAFKG